MLICGSVLQLSKGAVGLERCMKVAVTLLVDTIAHISTHAYCMSFDIWDWMCGFFGRVSRFSFWKGRYMTVTYDRYTGAAPLHRLFWDAAR